MACLRLVALALVCCILTCLASTSQGSSFSVLNIDFIGRGGGTHGLVARTGDIDNVVWNASGLGPLEGDAGFASYMDYLVGIRGGTAGYRGRWRMLGYGVYLSYLTSGSLTRTVWEDPTGGLGITFTYTEIVLGLAQGLAVLPNLSLGTGLKIARQNVEDDAASGAFADLGATFRIRPGRWWAGSGTSIQATLVTRNLTLGKWGDEAGDAPLNAEVGVVMQAPAGGLTAGVSFYVGRDDRREIRTGFSALLSDEFEVRLGYRRRVGRMGDSAADLPWERGLLGGFGVGFGSVWIDYTFEDASPLDGVHRFGLRVGLGRL
jgi:hypothetical protein